MSEATKEILRVDGVGVEIGGNVILSGIGFTVSEREIVALIGPNGAGKTMLIKAILGLIPHSGSISFSGLGRTAPEIGYVPQRFSFDRAFPITVHEFISLTEKEDPEKMGILKEFGLDHLHDRRIGSLSGGEMQRVLVARAVMGHPKLLLLDEPTSGIDVEGVKDFYSMIEFIRKEFGMAIIMISHEINAVYKLADKIVCLNKSQVCYGSPEKALTSEMMEKLYGHEVGMRGHHHENNHEYGDHI